MAARAVATLMAAVLVVLPSSADGARRPYGSERRAIAATMGTLPECLTIRVSTVREGWAVARPRACAAGDGQAILRRGRSHRWRIRYQGPMEPSSTPCSYTPEVPARVGRDLRFCR